MPKPNATQDTPLAPSVEKAYYRKCIELKRRLNEVEAANDEAKVRRVRLDRAVMKMRLERAFLLEQLAKRMEYNVDGSDGSADEGMATPPPERPHRDKRRRQQQPSTTQASGAGGVAPRSSQPLPGDGPTASASNGRRSQISPEEGASQPAGTRSPRERSAGRRVSGQANGTTKEERAIDRGARAVGEPIGAGPRVVEDSNGDRRVLAGDTEGGGAGFSSVN